MTGAFEDLKQPDKSEFKYVTLPSKTGWVTNIDQPGTHWSRALRGKSEFEEIFGL